MVVQNGSVDLVYLADRTSPNRFDLLKRMRAQALATDGVQEALYREPNPADGGTANTLAGAHPSWHLDGARTGDLVVSRTTGRRLLGPGLVRQPAHRATTAAPTRATTSSR